MKPVVPLLGAVAVLVAAVPLTVTQAADPPAAGSSFTLTEGKVAEAFADAGKKGMSVGDGFTFTGSLTRDGKAHGRFSSACTVQDLKGDGEFLCIATFVLPSGQLSGQALVRSGSGTGVVTGGTGSYVGARGTFSVGGRGRTTYAVTLAG